MPGRSAPLTISHSFWTYSEGAHGPRTGLQGGCMIVAPLNTALNLYLPIILYIYAVVDPGGG